MSEELIEQHASCRRKAKAHDQVKLFAARHVKHDQEQNEADECASEVFLEYDDEKRNGPHDKQRGERSQIGHAETTDAHGENGEHLAVLRQIRREEYNDANLCDFAWLETERANAEPDSATENFFAEAGNHGGEQQRYARNHECVFVAREFVDVSNDEQGNDHERYAQEKPQDLAYGQCGG